MAWIMTDELLGVPTAQDAMVSSEEELLGIYEEVLGFRPILRETEDGLKVRFYHDPDLGTVYDGMPQFDQMEWYHRGANWRTVAQPADGGAR